MSIIHSFSVILILFLLLLLGTLSISFNYLCVQCIVLQSIKYYRQKKKKKKKIVLLLHENQRSQSHSKDNLRGMLSRMYCHQHQHFTAFILY